jgi:PDZ domain-containing protein
VSLSADQTGHSGRKGTTGKSSLPGVLTYLLIICALVVPVPYMIQKPGPVFNTLGGTGEGDHTPLLSITGMKTYPLSGQLDMLTVGVVGGPGRRVNASQAVQSVIAGHDTVLPKEAYYPLTTTAEEVDTANTAEMASSQDLATAAALTELGVDFGSALAVAQVTPGSPADGTLRPDDRILRIDSSQVSGDNAGAKTVQTRVAKGRPVDLTIQRGKTKKTVTIRPTQTDGKFALGIVLGQKYDFPVTVKYNVEGVGGPSAGTIFALTIIDALTPGDLTGGKPIAGTGAITADGTVQPIGGARQKVAAAAASGNEYFLAPRDNCAEVLEAAAQTDLHVVRIDDLKSARASVEKIAAGRTNGLPACGTN